MKKRILTGITALSLTIFLTGCGSNTKKLTCTQSSDSNGFKSEIKQEYKLKDNKHGNGSFDLLHTISQKNRPRDYPISDYLKILSKPCPDIRQRSGLRQRRHEPDGAPDPGHRPGALGAPGVRAVLAGRGHCPAAGARVLPLYRLSGPGLRRGLRQDGG